MQFFSQHRAAEETSDATVSIGLQVHDTPDGKKEPEESLINASPGRPMREQTTRSGPECSSSTTRQVKRGRVENWACLNYSCLSDEEIHKFIHELRNMCVAIGMDMNPDPEASVNLNCAVPSVVESNWLYMQQLVERGVIKMHTGLLIVILSDFRSCDVEVEQRCKSLDVEYRTFLPEHVRTSSNQYLNSVACEINAKVLFLNVLFDSLMAVQDGRKFAEEIRAKCLSRKLLYGMKIDDGSEESSRPTRDLGQDDKMEEEHFCDEDMGEYGDSLDALDPRDVLDNEMEEYYSGVTTSDSEDDDEYSDSGDSEDDESEFESKQLDGEQMREDDGPEPANCVEGIKDYIVSVGSTDLPPPFTAFMYPDECVLLLKAGWGTKVAYKKPSNVSWDDYSKLFDANGYYKLIKGKPEEDRSLVSAAEGPLLSI
ncbi:hypothetical protein EJB05_41764 [Eragrostis curvula]|uniref:Uncharacterized protein n=1 Tax=Eragrostis curvula TaxID=38414 RepID=A0A5J9TCL8_9POAL|nr:hypothetical protein EJB05_41764 [Eragrostis curvula]